MAGPPRVRGTPTKRSPHVGQSGRNHGTGLVAQLCESNVLIVESVIAESAVACVARIVVVSQTMDDPAALMSQRVVSFTSTACCMDLLNCAAKTWRFLFQSSTARTAKRMARRTAARARTARRTTRRTTKRTRVRARSTKTRGKPRLATRTKTADECVSTCLMSSSKQHLLQQKLCLYQTLWL